MMLEAILRLSDQARNSVVEAIPKFLYPMSAVCVAFFVLRGSLNLLCQQPWPRYGSR